MKTASRVQAVVPTKAFAKAKLRLAGILNVEQRAALAAAMLRDVLGTLVACRSLGRVIVVTPEANAARIARDFGAEVLSQPGDGLNATLTGAAEFIGQDAAMLVVPADVPHITATTVHAAAAALANAGSVVLARATRDGGTNLFGCNPASALQPAFGADSYARHRAAAETARLRIHPLRNSEIQLDLDEPADLSAFLALNSQTQTDALLRRWYPPLSGEGRHAKRVGMEVVEILPAPPPPPTPPPKGEESLPQHIRVRA